MSGEKGKGEGRGESDNSGSPTQGDATPGIWVVKGGRGGKGGEGVVKGELEWRVRKDREGEGT